MGSRKEQGTYPRHPILICIFSSNCSSDDDPCETLDRRGRKNTLRRSEQEMTTQTLDRSETQKEHGGTKKAINPSGLVSTNATLIMLKQEEQLKGLNSLGLI